jgi:tetratricopeptide (TPR) repeat protein
MEERISVGGERRQSHWILAALTVAAGLLGSAAIGIGLPKKSAEPPDPIRDNNRGVALMEQFKSGEASEAFRRVTVAAPGWAPGFANLGLAALYARQIEDAEAALREAVRIDPGLIQGHYGLAMLEKNRGDSAAAIASLEKARALDPNDAQILYNLGLLRARQRRFPEAIAFLRQAKEIDPNSMSVRYQLARALLQAGDNEAGEKEMAEYQRLSSDENFSVPTGNQYGESGPYALVISDYSGLAAEESPVPPAEVRFIDVTADSGIAFVPLRIGRRGRGSRWRRIVRSRVRKRVGRWQGEAGGVSQPGKAAVRRCDRKVGCELLRCRDGGRPRRLRQRR